MKTGQTAIFAVCPLKRAGSVDSRSERKGFSHIFCRKLRQESHHPTLESGEFSHIS